MTIQLFRIAVLVTVLSGGVTGCATNPVTGKSEIAFVSQEKEISIGKQQYLPAQQTQGGLYLVDRELTQYVREVGNRLAAVSDNPLPYEFVVVNDSTPNAWALPGGKIAVHRGLLVQLDNEAELAAVLSHEIVHAAARHGAKSMERAMLLQGALVLTALGTRDSDYSNYIVGGASLGAQLISQRYGRQAELEADLYGMRYMAKAGYDPSAAITLQEKFVALNKEHSASWIEGLFASHPPSEQRVATNRETNEAIKASQFKDWEMGESRFQQRLSYLNSMDDAYRAFDQANVLLAKKENAVAGSRVNRAISLEPAEPRFYGLKADIFFNEHKYEDAISAYNTAVSKDEDYYEYYLGRGIAHSKLGNRNKARLDLERSNQLLPTALATNELGRLALQAGDRHSAKNYFAQVADVDGPLRQSATLSYVRLDIADNPSKYFKIKSERRQGRFHSIVTNRSGLVIRSGVVAFSALINGRQYQTQRNIGSIAVNGKLGIYPGWKLDDSDTVENIEVRMVRVRL